MASPDAESHRFTRVQADRDALESHIHAAGLDLELPHREERAPLHARLHQERQILPPRPQAPRRRQETARAVGGVTGKITTTQSALVLEPHGASQTQVLFGPPLRDQNESLFG